ncbi:hypothetical protein [Ammoniphilus resinae]|uniref:Uncharacterized protein n=1 Tax=Ammoniphilus resinae TaxID=861532 RepID=A0ABS4GNP2_9BACL|nr:hypothetical protein [Ammoniphilus resinae]MBP1931889.1 hypothetical protein [Ammoniphilus resinae]
MGKVDFKYLKHRIATIRFELKLLFIISVASILVIDLWLINIPERFSGGAALGGIYYQFCLAYITSFLFYFINVHLESERQKVKLIKYINNKSAKINRLCDTVITSIREAAGIPSTIKINKEYEINIICDYVDPRRPFTIGGWYGRTFHHWQAAAEFIAFETKDYIRDLLFVRDSLDSDVVEILLDIDDILHIINISHGSPSRNSDMEFYSHSLIEYQKLCQDLIKMIRVKYKFHQDEYRELFRKNNGNRY